MERNNCTRPTTVETMATLTPEAREAVIAILSNMEFTSEQLEAAAEAKKQQEAAARLQEKFEYENANLWKQIGVGLPWRSIYLYAKGFGTNYAEVIAESLSSDSAPVVMGLEIGTKLTNIDNDLNDVEEEKHMNAFLANCLELCNITIDEAGSISARFEKKDSDYSRYKKGLERITLLRDILTAIIK